VYGVRTVADEIEVKLGASKVRDDSDIAEDITQALKSNSAIPVDVTTELSNGHVTLRGEVLCTHQQTEAQRAIRNIEGVHNVSNMITIKPPPPEADDHTGRASDAIDGMADLDARSVWVSTSNRSAQLHGDVHSFAEVLAKTWAPQVARVEDETIVTP